MSDINVELVQYGKLDELTRRRLTEEGFSCRRVSRVIRRPKRGIYTVDVDDFCYIERMMGYTLYDWVEMPDGQGYYLILPPGFPPRLPDPLPVQTSTGSKTQLAVLHWLEFGGTKASACQLYGAHVSNFYVVMRRMQKRGEI